MAKLGILLALAALLQLARLDCYTEEGPSTVDQQNTVFNSVKLSVHGGNYQSFTPSRSSRIKSIDLYVGQLYYSFTLSITVYEGRGRGGPVLGQGSVGVPESNDNFYSVTFQPPIPVNADTEYSFGFECSNQGCGVGYSTANPYTRGLTGRWGYGSVDTNYDYGFRIWSPPTTNICLVNNGGCSGNTTCASIGHCTGSCVCPSGYSLSNSRCLPINNCLTSNGGCGDNSACTYTGPGTSTCACNAGYYSPQNTGKSCTALTVCDGVTNYQTVPPTLTSNRECGSVSPPCDGVDTYQTSAPTPTSNRVCSAVRACDGVTNYQTTAPTPTSDRVCSLTTVCNGVTTYQTTAPTLTSDRVCSATAVCNNVTTYQTTPPTITSNRVCSLYTVCTLTQYQSTAPTPTSNRECTDYDIPPTFQKSTYSWIIRREALPTSASGETSIAQLLVSSSGGDVRLSFTSLSSDSKIASSSLGLSLRGDVLVASFAFYQALNRITLPLVGVIRATDSRSKCVTPTMSLTHGCYVEAAFQLSVTQFNPQCPQSTYTFTTDSSVAVSWRAPRLYLLDGPELPLTASIASGTVLQEGRTHVTYAASLGQDSSQFESTRVACNFDVTVKNGHGVVADSIGHFYDFSPARVGRPAQEIIRDFIIDGSGIRGGGAKTSGVQADVRNHGIILGVIAASGLQFQLVPPANHTNQFVVDMEWCTHGTMTWDLTESASAYIQGSTSVTLLGVADSQTDSGNMELAMQQNLHSLMTHDGRCFWLRAKTDAFDFNGVFSGINLQFTHDAQPVERRASDVRSYAPVLKSGGLIVQYVLTDGEAPLAKDPGTSVHVNDFEKPQITGCPPDIEIVALDGALAASVSWIEPTSSDNVEVAEFSKTAVPGANFTVAGSPHTVTYTAKDTSGWTDTCSFTVSVQYVKVQATTSVEVDGLLLASSDVSDVLGTVTFYDYWLSSASVDDDGPELSINQTDYNAVTVELKAKHGDKLALRPPAQTSDNDVTVQLEVDLVFAVAAHQPAQYGTANVFTSAVFTGATAIDGKPAFFAESWFESSSSLSTFEEGSYVRFAGVSRSLESSLLFEGLSVTLNMPSFQAASDAVPFTLVLQPESYVRFAYYFDNVNASLGAAAYSGFLQVHDTEAPTFGDSCPTSQQLDALAGQDYAVATWTQPAASDNRRVTTLTSSYESGAQFKIGTTPVEYTAHDAYGNKAVCTFSIVVVDSEMPAIQCPQDLTVNATQGRSTYAVPADQLQPIVSDNSGAPVVAPVTTEFAIGTHTVTRTATDSSGNTKSCTMQVVVHDTQPPVFSNCQTEDLKFQSPNDVSGVQASWSAPTVTDNDNSQAVDITETHQSPHVFPIGTTAVRYVATDASGNTATCAFNVVVASGPSSSSSSSGGLSVDTSVIAGVCTGLGVLLLIIVVVAVLLRRARAKNRRPHNFDAILDELSDINTGDGPRKPREIKRVNIKVLDVLGKGNFGEVSKGLLSEIAGAPGYLVAIKILHVSFDADRSSLLQEAAIMAQFNSPRVVGLVGVVTVDNPLMVVIEYCEHGALNKYLEKTELSLEIKFMIAADCAEGLAYLASRNFVHRDVAARNVLVSSERRAKIADFGMSRDTSQSAYYQSKGGQIPVRWTAPEALEDHKFSSMSDCWSFGVLLFEIWTRAELPYKGMSNQKVWVSVSSGYRLPCPEGCPKAVYKQMTECWNADPHARPRFDALHEQLRKLEAGDKTAADGSMSSRTASASEVYGHAYTDFTSGTGSVPQVGGRSGPLTNAGYSRQKLSQVVEESIMLTLQTLPPARRDSAQLVTDDADDLDLNGEYEKPVPGSKRYAQRPQLGRSRSVHSAGSSSENPYLDPVPARRISSINVDPNANDLDLEESVEFEYALPGGYLQVGPSRRNRVVPDSGEDAALPQGRSLRRRSSLI